MKQGVKLTYEEKYKIVEQICNDYLEGNTLESCLESSGLSWATFYNWQDEYKEIKELYKKTREKVNKAYKDRLKQKARTSLEKKIEGWEHPEAKVFNDKGNLISTEVTKHYPADVTAIIFALTNLDPDNFKHMQKIDHTTAGESLNEEDLSNLSTEEKKQLLALKRKARQKED